MTLDPRRNGLLTASDFGAACGVNPYCSRQKLFRLKTGREVFEGNERTAWGNDNEAAAIAKYEAASGNLVTPGAFIVNPHYPTLGATPDAFVGDFGLLEVKAPTSGLYNDVPEYYLAQVIGQIAIAGRKWCDFSAWVPEETRIWRVEMSGRGWAWMLPRLEEMCYHIANDTPPKKYGAANKKPTLGTLRALVSYHRTT